MDEMTRKFKDVQGKLCEASYQKNRTYAYSAGYFQSLSEMMFAQLTKKQKAEFLRQVENDAYVLEKLNAI